VLSLVAFAVERGKVYTRFLDWRDFQGGNEIKKAVVTGGAGFIGSHLAEELVNQGYSVIILDDLSSGKIENIADLLSEKKVEFIHGSVTDLPLLSRAFRGVSYVFHLAAVSSVAISIENPRQTHEVNVGGTLNVLLAVRERGVAKVIYASSAAVYGDAPGLPKKEDMTPQPLSPYAASKLAGEHYCQAFQRVYDLPTAALRYFNVYGPRQNPESQYAAVVPKFISRILSGNSPVIFGDGEQTRDFTFVKDAVNATILAAESDVSGIFNVANGESISVNRLVRLIVQSLKTDVRPVYDDPRLGDIKHSLADISLAKAFGYQPAYTLEAGLNETIRWFSNK
jgi:UDP-glucose 4-epimerase